MPYEECGRDQPSLPRSPRNSLGSVPTLRDALLTIYRGHARLFLAQIRDTELCQEHSRPSHVNDLLDQGITHDQLTSPLRWTAFVLEPDPKGSNKVCNGQRWVDFVGASLCFGIGSGIAQPRSSTRTAQSGFCVVQCCKASFKWAIACPRSSEVPRCSERNMSIAPNSLNARMRSGLSVSNWSSTSVE